MSWDEDSYDDEPEQISPDEAARCWTLQLEGGPLDGAELDVSVEVELEQLPDAITFRYETKTLTYIKHEDRAPAMFVRGSWPTLGVTYRYERPS